MSEISCGVTSSILTRAADVVLKERRRLVLLVRETPLHLGHLRTMAQLTEMGAIIMPPVPAFYSRPETVDDIVDHTVGRALDLFSRDRNSPPLGGNAQLESKGEIRFALKARRPHLGDRLACLLVRSTVRIGLLQWLFIDRKASRRHACFCRTNVA